MTPSTKIFEKNLVLGENFSNFHARKSKFGFHETVKTYSGFGSSSRKGPNGKEPGGKEALGIH